MGTAEIIARELGGVEKIIDSLVNFDARIDDALWARTARKIIKRLRNLYFREAGTLGFLRSIADGKPVSPEIMAEVKSHFFEYEETVTNAVIDLRRKCDIKNIQITPCESDLLEGIVHDKTNIRAWIKDMFYILEQGDVDKPTRDLARELCRHIDALNAKFQDADARLRARI